MIKIYKKSIKKNNFTKRQIVNLISKYINGCEIEFQKHGNDPRNY